MNVRNCGEDAVMSAPASEPRPKATRVAPNAISMNFMFNTAGSGLLRAEAA